MVTVSAIPPSLSILLPISGTEETPSGTQPYLGSEKYSRDDGLATLTTGRKLS